LAPPYKMSSLGRPSSRDFCTPCLILTSPCGKQKKRMYQVWSPLLGFWCSLVTTLLDVLKQMGVTLGIFGITFYWGSGFTSVQQIVAQLLQKLPAFHYVRRIIIVFTRMHQRVSLLSQLHPVVLL